MRLLTIAAIAIAIAAAGAGVLAASEHQRTIARTNFNEAESAVSLQVDFLSQERALDSYLASGSTSDLRAVFTAGQKVTAGLESAQRLSRDKQDELQPLTKVKAALASWQALAEPTIARAERGQAFDIGSAERRRGVFVTRFERAGAVYQERLAANRVREERSAALLPIWVLIGDLMFFGALGVVLATRSRRARNRSEHYNESQRRFVEAMQFARDESEAQGVLVRHVERGVDGSAVLLNRNNSADRLEAVVPLASDSPLADVLPAIDPRSCLAVRLNRRYARSDSSEALVCGVCDCLGGSVACQPLLVGGEVIGSLLIERSEPLDARSTECLEDSVSQAAPILANLRNLAIAESQAATDALTGLPNRRAAEDTLRRVRAISNRSERPFSILLLDLDHFKQINDTHGHESGDDVLAAVGSSLQSSVRESDFVARTGGEEFLVCLTNTGTPAAAAVAENLLVSLRGLRVAGVKQSITASVGVAAYPRDGETIEALLRAADRALYSAKHRGRDCVEIAVEANGVEPRPIADFELDFANGRNPSASE